MKNAESSEPQYEYRWGNHVYEECKYYWLWPGWIQRGAINTMSDVWSAQYVVADIANRIHKGQRLPDGWIAEPHPVVWIADRIAIQKYEPAYPILEHKKGLRYWDSPTRTQDYLADFRQGLTEVEKRGHSTKDSLLVFIGVAAIYSVFKDALNILVSEGHTILVSAPCYRYLGFENWAGVFPGMEVENLEDNNHATHRLHSGYQHPAATPIDFVSQDDRGPWWVCRDRYQISGGYEGE